MTQSPVRLWIAAGVAAALLVSIFTWLVVIGPQRERVADRRIELSAAQTQTASLRTRLSALAAQFVEIDARQAELAVKRQAMPTANDLQTLERAIDVAAAATGVTVEATAADQPVDLTPEPPPPPRVEPGAKPTTAPPAEEGAMPAQDAAPVWPVFGIPVSIRVSGTLLAIEDFLRVLQSEQPRAVLVNTIKIVPELGGTSFSERVVMTAGIQVFLSPAAPSAFVAPAGS